MYKRFMATSLLIAAAICPLSAKTDSVVGKSLFIQKSETEMTPVFPVTIRVRLDHGKYSPKLAMECKLVDRTVLVVISGQPTEAHQMVLVCPEGTYIVTGVNFAPVK